MRILYHHRTLADGAEGIHIAAMVGAFRGLGHDVRVLGASPSHAARRGARFINTVRSVTPRPAFELAALGLNIPESVRVWREIRRFKPDLLYKRHAKYDLAALAAARRAGIPAVLEVNSLFSAPDYEQFEPLAFPRVARSTERRALRIATVVVAVSTPLAVQARAMGDVDVIVVPNGADPAVFDPGLADGARIRARYGLGDTPIIGWTGIVREWHGLDLLLRAVAMVPPGVLLVVGDGPARAALERSAAQLGLENRLVITGRVRHDEVRDYIAAMDIAVVAAEKTGIASPMKLLEYMSMARAVVAPHADNFLDLIEDGVDGLLFSPGDSVDLAAKLRALFCDGVRRQTVGRGARAKIESRRNWRRIAETVLAHIDDRV